MTQLPLLEDDPIHRLVLFGYTEREASFLYLAGLQSGFFLRRQYCHYSGVRAGRPDTALVEKLLAKGHATAVAGCRKTVIYHLGARPFYTALGVGDNRNRRMRPADSIKSRLMALDYILDHPGPRYLSTEQEKILYFTSLGIATADLPRKLFRSPGGNDSTTRLFPDKFPIFVPKSGPTPPLVGFCFIDEGLATCSRFEAYLRQYRSLFGQLQKFELVYVAISRDLFWEAENVFRAFQRAGTSREPLALDPHHVARLLAHFEDRLRAENGYWDSFDRSKLIRLREERQEFSGPFFDSLYERWQTAGEAAVLDMINSKSSATRSLSGMFSTHLLRHNYDVFGSTGGDSND